MAVDADRSKTETLLAEQVEKEGAIRCAHAEGPFVVSATSLAGAVRYDRQVKWL